MSHDFARRSIVVTGATGELGAAVAEALLAQGAVCHLPCRSAGKLEPLVGRFGDRARAVPNVDLGDEASVRAFYADLPDLWASVHCVGAFRMAPAADTSLADVLEMHAVNALSAFACSREAVRKLRASNRGGRIVNVASRQALDPSAGKGAIAYTMSKAAVAAMTRALAAEVAAEGILVNAVAPSTLSTPANRAAMPDADHSRWPTPAEVASVIAFLISPANTTVSGAIVPAFGRA